MEPLKGRGPHLRVSTSPRKGTDVLTRRHCHIPTSQAPDSPATEVLHGLRVHSGFAGRVGGPPEEQATWGKTDTFHIPTVTTHAKN